VISNRPGSAALAFLDAISSSVERFDRYERSITPDVGRRTPWAANRRDQYMGVVYLMQEEVARSVAQLMLLVGRKQVPEAMLRLARDPSWEEAERARRAERAEAERVRRQRTLDQVRDEEVRHQVNVARRSSDATRRLRNAIRRADVAAVEALLARGADARAVGGDGRTMRQLAEASGDVRILEMITRAQG
jgi:hypothetical protein